MAKVLAGERPMTVGEPVLLEVTYDYGQGSPPVRRLPNGEPASTASFRREVFIEATLEGGEFSRMFMDYRPSVRRVDEDGNRYVARYELLCGLGTKAPVLMFARPGRYMLTIRDDMGVSTAPLSVTVAPPSETTSKALAILSENDHYLAFMVFGEPSDELNVKAMRRIATECKGSPLAVRAAARVGLERFAELRKKYPRTEEWRKLYRQEQGGGPVLDEVKSYLTEGMKLPVESGIREEVVATLAKIVWIGGDSQRARSLLVTLGEQYPKGRFGRDAGKALKEMDAIEAKERKATTHPRAATQPAPATRPAGDSGGTGQ
jgi:hypothetical protein